MNYRVRFSPRTNRALASIWINAADRAAVTRATASTERHLANDPFAVGESRPGNRGVFIVDPLTVFYRVDRANRTVVVVDVHAPSRRP